MSGLTRPRPRLGLYEVPFWEHVDRGELRLQQCRSCRTFRYPPGPSCASCGSGDYDWEPICGDGSLLSWTVFRRQYFDELPVPYTVVAVATVEGPILIANLVGTEGASPHIGMRLKLTYEDVMSDDGNWRIYQWTLAADSTHYQEETP